MIILDSSLIISYFNERDENHKKAVEAIEKISTLKYGTSYITDYIFNEIVTVALIKLKDKNKAVYIGNALLNAFELLEVDNKIFLDAWKVFKEQKDTALSFTDCTIISTMRYKEMIYLATFDKEFKKIEGIKIIE